jgi:monovalent cation/proton antiporter MnhG/PhaG subunit
MSPREAIVIALLALGAGAELLCCAGLLLAHDIFDRLHLAGAANILGPVVIAAAVVIDGHNAQTVLKAALLAVALVVVNPIVTYAIARAARIRAEGAIEAKTDAVGK